MDLQIIANIGQFILTDPATNKEVATQSVIFPPGSESDILFVTGYKTHRISIAAFKNGGGQLEMNTTLAGTAEEVILPVQVEPHQTYNNPLFTLIG